MSNWFFSYTQSKEYEGANKLLYYKEEYTNARYFIVHFTDKREGE